MTSTSSASAAHDVNACVKLAQSGLDVSGIAQKALVVHGTADRVVPYENGVNLAKALPNATLHTMEGAGQFRTWPIPRGSRS